MARTRTEAQILSDVLALPRESQCRIRDAIPKRQRGRPRGNKIFAIKDAALKLFNSLPESMTEIEKCRAVQTEFPALSWGPLRTLVTGNDWRFNTTKNRDYSWNEPNLNQEQD